MTLQLDYLNSFCKFFSEKMGLPESGINTFKLHLNTNEILTMVNASRTD